MCYRFFGCDYVRSCHSYVVNDDYCTCTATTERLQQAIRAGGQQPVGTTVAPPRPNLVHSPQPARRLQYTPGAGESKYADEGVAQKDDDDNDDGNSNTTNASTKKRKTNDVMQSRRSAKKDSKKQKKDSPSGTHISNTHIFWVKQW